MIRRTMIMMMTIKVPCLVIDGLVLTQSVAIMEYLADRWVLMVTVMTIMTMMVMMILMLVDH